MILLEKSCGTWCGLLECLLGGQECPEIPHPHTHTPRLALSIGKAIMQILPYVLGPY